MCSFYVSTAYGAFGPSRSLESQRQGRLKSSLAIQRHMGGELNRQPGVQAVGDVISKV